MQTHTSVKKDAIYFYEQNMPAVAMADDIHSGLQKTQKTLPPKYFYDKKGSELFDQITALPEYYLTRTEVELLGRHIDDMAELIGRGSILLELGSGSSTKIRMLLEAIRPSLYVPMDISREHLLESAQLLANDYPWLNIHASCVDFSKPWAVPDFGPGRYNVFFPGSSISNFDPADALALLRQVSKLVGHGGGLLIGVDLKKDRDVLEAAYNDRQGVTAQFNLNMLNHINQSLDADFDLGHYTHRAIYNETEGRIEMHLECTRDHVVSIEHASYHFQTGETIHTENSYKYSVEGFHKLAGKAGFKPVKVWSDDDNLFSIHYLAAT